MDTQRIISRPDPALARAAIIQLAASIRAPAGATARTIEDVDTDADGVVSFETLAAEMERIAAEIGLAFEWVSNDVRSACFTRTEIDQLEPVVPQDWRTKYKRLDVCVTQGSSEGWIVRVHGARRERREIGDPEVGDVLLVAKYLGCRFEATWLGCAIREFLIA